jgi:hypothetical protein
MKILLEQAELLLKRFLWQQVICLVLDTKNYLRINGGTTKKSVKRWLKRVEDTAK